MHALCSGGVQTAWARSRRQLPGTTCRRFLCPARRGGNGRSCRVLDERTPCPTSVAQSSPDSTHARHEGGVDRDTDPFAMTSMRRSSCRPDATLRSRTKTLVATIAVAPASRQTRAAARSSGAPLAGNTPERGGIRTLFASCRRPSSAPLAPPPSSVAQRSANGLDAAVVVPIVSGGAASRGHRRDAVACRPADGQ